MTSDTAPAPLRAARMARGWSQAAAAQEISALGLRRGVPVASGASLKTLLSRWENGHVVPEPQYRELLAELFGRAPAELGIDPATATAGTTAPGSATSRLRAAVAAAAAVDDAVLELWRAQLAVARRLDDELGAAGAGGVVRAHVEQLDHTLTHCLTPGARAAVAGALTGAAALAGAQALDRRAHDEAWHSYEKARTAAVEARMPVAASVALSGLSAVLVDAGEAGSAVTLLGDEPPEGPAAARVRWQAARGMACAEAGHADAALAAFTAAEQSLQRAMEDRRARGATPVQESAAPAGPSAGAHGRIDSSAPLTPPVELADLHRWHGHALAALGSPEAATVLQRSLDQGPRSIRHRAALHADLAAALEAAHPEAAAAHAGQARALATRIGSERIAARLTRAGTHGATSP